MSLQAYFSHLNPITKDRFAAHYFESLLALSHHYKVIWNSSGPAAYDSLTAVQRPFNPYCRWRSREKATRLEKKRSEKKSVMDSCVMEVQLRELEWKTKTAGLLRGTMTFFSLTIVSYALLVTVHVAACCLYKCRKPFSCSKPIKRVRGAPVLVMYNHSPHPPKAVFLYRLELGLVWHLGLLSRQSPGWAVVMCVSDKPVQGVSLQSMTL